MELDPSASRFVTYQSKAMRLYSVLGIDGFERSIIITMLSDAGPWSASALATYLNCSRQTLTRKLSQRAEQHFCVKTDRGWTCTEYGRLACIAVINEITRVISGEQKTLSKETIDICCTNNPNGNAKEASLVSFTKCSK